MSMDPNNPYSSPSAGSSIQPAATVLPPPITSMDYMRMITYVFENPNWFMNLLLGALCSIIPVIGGLVLMGYAFEVAVSLIATNTARYPDFNFVRFGDYLMRGLWPFLVYLVAGLVFAPLYVVIAMISAIADNKAVAIIFFPIQLALAFVFAVAVQPMLLRAALTLDFTEGFKFEWIKDFIRRVGIEMLLGTLFLGIASTILSFVGLLACCVGVFLVIPILSLAHANLLFQIYSLYITRGGTPIPIKLTNQPMLGPPM